MSLPKLERDNLICTSSGHTYIAHEHLPGLLRVCVRCGSTMARRRRNDALAFRRTSQPTHPKSIT